MIRLNGEVFEYLGVSCETKFTHVSGPGTSDGLWHVDVGASLSITDVYSISLFSQIFSLLRMALLLNLVMG